MNDSQFIIHSKFIHKNFTDNIHLFISFDTKFNDKRFQEIGTQILNNQTILLDNLLLDRCSQKTTTLEKKIIEFKEFYKHLSDSSKFPEHIELHSKFLNNLKIETKENRQVTLNFMNELSMNLIRNCDKYFHHGLKDNEMKNFQKLHDELTNDIHLMDLYCHSISEIEQKTMLKIDKLKIDIAEIKQAAINIYKNDKEAALKFFVKNKERKSDNYRKYIEMKETYMAMECKFDEGVYFLFENEGNCKLEFSLGETDELKTIKSLFTLEPNRFRILKAKAICTNPSGKLFVTNNEDLEGLYRITLLC